jgi:hypothetical protein
MRRTSRRVCGGALALRRSAKNRGVRFGRPTALTPHQRAEALQPNGEVQADLARSFLWRLCKRDAASA